MKTMKNSVRKMNILFPLIILMALFLMAPHSYAEDAWLPEFEDICNKTDESNNMKKEELRTMIARCDKLRSSIEKSDNRQKNVYLFRLDKCRKLFTYVLEVNDK
jgi:hypothetical protein